MEGAAENLENYAGSGDRPGEDNAEVTHTNFLDERPAAVGSGRPMGGGPNAFPRPNVMPEDPFTARDLMKKPILIRNVQWTTAQARGDSLLTPAQAIDVPAIISEIGTVQHNVLETFAFFKLDLIIRIVVNTSKFHQGRLIASVDPFHQMIDGPLPADKLFAKQFNIFAASMLPGAQIDAARSNVVELFVPWEHIQDYLTTNSKDSFDIMARIRLNVLNPLDVQTGGTTSANVMIFMSAKDVSVNVPIQPHDTKIPTFRLALERHFPGMRADGLSEMFEGGKKAVGAVASGIKDVTSGDIGGVVSDFKNLLGGLNEVAEGFDFDRPAMTGAGYVNMIAPVAPLSHVRGADSSVRLGAFPVGAYNIHPAFSGAKDDEMSIKRLCQVKGLVEIHQWTTAQEPGTIIRRIPVMPGFCAWDRPVATGRPRNRNTFLSYLSSFFLFWRGSIEFEFDFVSTMMQTGRVGFAFVPNAVDRTHVYTAAELSNCPVAYFDLQGGIKRINITVPYQSAVPRKLFVPWANVNEDNFTDNHITGYLYVFVQNQLATPNSTPSTIEINCYVGAGPDFELDVPRQRPENLFIDTQPYTPEVPAFRADACDEPTTESTQPNPTAPNTSAETSNPSATICGVDNDLQSRESVPIPRNVLAAGDKQVSFLNAYKEGGLNVKDLARRYSKYLEILLPLPVVENSYGPALYNRTGTDPDFIYGIPNSRLRVGSFTLPVTPVLKTMYSPFDYQVESWASGGIPPPPPSAPLVFTPGASSTNLLCSAMSKPFALWSGGVRYKVQPQSSRLTGVNWMASYVMDEKEFVPSFEGRQAFGNFSAYPSHTGNFSQNACAEFEAPYYSVYNQCVTTTESLADPNALGNGSLVFTVAADANADFLDSFEEDTFVYDPTTGQTTMYVAGTQFIYFHVYAAAGDDIKYSYPVSPPDTYSDEQIVAPPASAINSSTSRQKLHDYRRCLKKAFSAFSLADRESFDHV